MSDFLNSNSVGDLNDEEPTNELLAVQSNFVSELLPSLTRGSSDSKGTERDFDLDTITPSNESNTELQPQELKPLSSSNFPSKFGAMSNEADSEVVTSNLKRACPSPKPVKKFKPAIPVPLVLDDLSGCSAVRTSNCWPESKVQTVSESIATVPVTLEEPMETMSAVEEIPHHPPTPPKETKTPPPSTDIHRTNNLTNTNGPLAFETESRNLNGAERIGQQLHNIKQITIAPSTSIKTNPTVSTEAMTESTTKRSNDNDIEVLHHFQLSSTTTSNRGSNCSSQVIVPKKKGLRHITDKHPSSTVTSDQELGVSSITESEDGADTQDVPHFKTSPTTAVAERDIFKEGSSNCELPLKMETGNELALEIAIQEAFMSEQNNYASNEGSSNCELPLKMEIGNELALEIAIQEAASMYEQNNSASNLLAPEVVIQFAQDLNLVMALHRSRYAHYENRFKQDTELFKQDRELALSIEAEWNKEEPKRINPLKRTYNLRKSNKENVNQELSTLAIPSTSKSTESVHVTEESTLRCSNEGNNIGQKLHSKPTSSSPLKESSSNCLSPLVGPVTSSPTKQELVDAELPDSSFPNTAESVAVNESTSRCSSEDDSIRK